MTDDARQRKALDSLEETTELSEAWLDPPQSPGDAMLIARPLKPRRLSFGGSTASGSGSVSLDDLATPQTTGGLDEALEAELRTHGPPPGIVDPVSGSCGSPRGGPPPPIPAPAMPSLSAPPPPGYDASMVLPDSKAAHAHLAEMPGPPAYGSWPVTPAAGMPPTPSRGFPPLPVLSSGPPTPSGHAPMSFNDASQRFVQRPVVQDSNALADDDAILVQALSLLSTILSGPAVPQLPPSGCYGGLRVSKAISEGLGSEAAEAAQAAADGHGETPVKVLLPQYPELPGYPPCDHTKPAKLFDFEEPKTEKQVHEETEQLTKQFAQILTQRGLALQPPPLVLPPPCRPAPLAMPVMPHPVAVVPR
mmetsp:Transcript_32291/g.60795  ORF Transcript_32291/g.60795 Transcript_32291/m.60795 type:complete len:363 (+) Transcript_32291:50-1138(+)